MSMGMELPVGVGEEKRRGREEGELPGHLGFGFVLGSGSAALSPPQKLFRTDASPFRSSSNSSSGPTSSYDCCGGAYDAARTLHTPLKSPGDMAPGVCPTPLRGISFTSVQWQELHRQALIYKYIMSAVPVPPDLLLPISARSSYPGASPHLLPPHLVGRGGGGCFNLRFTNSTDAEPGRCRRTDGKKWRCSRDVAPDQKYCERHMHRGRPRSRKHVEPPKIKATPKITTTTTTTTTTLATKASTATATAVTLPEGFPAGSSLKLPFQSMESCKEPRYTDWMKEDTGEMASTHQWELMNCNLGAMRSNTAPMVKGYEDQLDLNNYTNLHDHCCPFLDPDLSSLEEDAIAGAAHRDPPRSFIDAWSTETPTSVPLSSPQGKPCSVSDGGKLPPSTLTLSLPSGIERDTDQIEMGLGLSDSMARSQPALSWMAPVSPLGGPLAEVLRSSTATSPHNGRSSAGSSSCDAGLVNLVSKGFYGSHEVSPQDSPKRLASSPSGVLQKALASLSDSSSSGSPTFAAASGSEIARQWWRQSK